VRNLFVADKGNHRLLAYDTPVPAGSCVLTWTLTGALSTGRGFHTATRLPDGRVLAAGGCCAAGDTLASAEIYSPTGGLWTPTGSFATSRASHTATLLASGKVLVAGGGSSTVGVLASAELYEPAGGAWTPTGSMATAREGHTATL